MPIMPRAPYRIMWDGETDHREEREEGKVTIAQQLHGSVTHRAGFDVSCPQCLKDKGIAGIIEHLAYCARENERDCDSEANAVALEQRRMIAVLRLYTKVTACKP